MPLERGDARSSGTSLRGVGGDVVHPVRVIDEEHTFFGPHASVDMRSFGGLELGGAGNNLRGRVFKLLACRFGAGHHDRPIVRGVGVQR